MDYLLVPQPQSVRFQSTALLLPAALSLKESFDFEGLVQRVFTKLIFGQETEIGFAIEKDESFPKEGYSLRVNSRGICLKSSTRTGCFYGLQTLKQLYEQGLGRELPYVEIIDEPDFMHRGFMLDVSRCKVPKMDVLIDLIKLMASLKMNQLQLYIEHTFAFSNHVEVWGDSSALTGEEIQDLDTLCRENFIELIPNLNSFGHMERWLKLDKYKHLAECPDGFVHPISNKQHESGSTLFPSTDSLDFLVELYGEYLPHFSSGNFNIGGDEPWELGRGRSESIVGEKGKSVVYLEFMKAIHARVISQGKHMQCWADIFLESPGVIKDVPESITPIIWGYEPDFPFDEKCLLVSKTHPDFYLAPGNSSWNSFSCRLTDACKNLNTATASGKRFGASGILVTSWGDGGNHYPWLGLFPGLVKGAASSWSEESNREVDLEDYFHRFFFKENEPLLAKALIMLCRTDDFFKPNFLNASLPHKLLFCDWPDRSKDIVVLDGIDANTLHQSLIHLESVTALLAEIPKCDDTVNAFVFDIQLGVDLNRIGIKKGLLMLEGKPMDKLKNKLLALIPRYETGWKQFARSGGLEESVEHLKRAAELMG